MYAYAGWKSYINLNYSEIVHEIEIIWPNYIYFDTSLTILMYCYTAVFNTNTNSTLVQTYNQTTYKSCSIDDASDTDTFQYLGGSSEYGKALVVAVPLTTEGSQYFFSEADDGLQCQNGMGFQIKVGHGSGLPPSLNQPPPPPYVEPPSTVEEGQTPPITIVASPPSSGMRNIVGLLHLVVMAILVSYLSKWMISS